jgi:phosphopantothenoylcysteine decarboxylase/phosphopantothenate--cysteine ligase
VLEDIDLRDKNILLGVTGSVSIYKSLELVRLYIKCGANVKVIMTPSSKKFISTLLFETISKNIVLDESSESFANIDNHISITKWADVFVIAPTTANSINKFANGLANNFLSNTVLAYSGKILLAPAANTNMIKDHITQASIKFLQLNNFEIIEPQSKLLACGDEGVGALAEFTNIFLYTARELLEDEFWRYRKVVITSGTTKEKIDDVRYIANHSSGKMANSLAIALYTKGADVCIIGDIKDVVKNSSMNTIEISTTNEMKKYLQESVEFAKIPTTIKTSMVDKDSNTIVNKKPFLFMASAIGDYTPTFPNDGKIKKKDIGDTWELHLKQNVDLLSMIKKSDIYKIGFKAEFDKQNAVDSAKDAIKNKDLDAICLNILGEDINFGSDFNEIIFIKDNQEEKIEKDRKTKVSFEIADIISREFEI